MPRDKVVVGDRSGRRWQLAHDRRIRKRQEFTSWDHGLSSVCSCSSILLALLVHLREVGETERGIEQLEASQPEKGGRRGGGLTLQLKFNTAASTPLACPNSSGKCLSDFVK